jgi:uncharacterized protein (TIGR04255 family)
MPGPSRGAILWVRRYRAGKRCTATIRKSPARSRPSGVRLQADHASVPAIVTDVSPIPAFDDPPVEEVALAAHFLPISGWKSLDYARLADMWSAEYPIAEEMPPAPPVPDESGVIAGPPQIQIDFGAINQTRYWFRNDSGSRVIQIQRDRIVHNWRKQDPSEPYPHYSDLRPLFAKALGNLVDFAVERGFGPPRINQCEVTYVNPIPVAGPLARLEQFERLFAPWSGQFSDAFLSAPEGVSVSMRFPILEGDVVKGGLTVLINPGIRPPDQKPLYLLQIFARGRPDSDDVNGVMRFMDLGHEWVVRGFAGVTTPEMHVHWGRTI